MKKLTEDNIDDEIKSLESDIQRSELKEWANYIIQTLKEAGEPPHDIIDDWFKLNDHQRSQMFMTLVGIIWGMLEGPDPVMAVV